VPIASVAVHREWFDDDSYTPFLSAVTDSAAEGSAKRRQVVGIGTVRIPVKKSPNKSGTKSRGILELKNVLHVPTAPANSFVVDDNDYTVTLPSPRTERNPKKKSKGDIRTKDNKPVAYFDPERIYSVLKLADGPPNAALGPSLFLDLSKKDAKHDGTNDDKPPTPPAVTSVQFHWDATQRSFWEHYRKMALMDPTGNDQGSTLKSRNRILSQDKERKGNSPLFQVPYSEEEKKMLMQWDSEAGYLEFYGLGTVEHEDNRADGRALFRTLGLAYAYANDVPGVPKSYADWYAAEGLVFGGQEGDTEGEGHNDEEQHQDSHEERKQQEQVVRGEGLAEEAETPTGLPQLPHDAQEQNKRKDPSGMTKESEKQDDGKRYRKGQKEKNDEGQENEQSESQETHEEEAHMGDSREVRDQVVHEGGEKNQDEKDAEMNQAGEQEGQERGSQEPQDDYGDHGEAQQGEEQEKVHSQIDREKKQMEDHEGELHGGEEVEQKGESLREHDNKQQQKKEGHEKRQVEDNETTQDQVSQQEQEQQAHYSDKMNEDGKREQEAEREREEAALALLSLSLGL